MKVFEELNGVDVICHIKPCTPNINYYHCHDNIEIAKVLDDNCAFLIDGVHYRARPGDMIFVPSRAVHRFLIESPMVQIMVCQLSPKLLSPLSSLLGNIRHFLAKEELEANPELAGQIHALLDWMKDEEPSLTGKQPNMVLQTMMLSLYHLLLRNFSCPAPSPEDEKARAEFREIFQYVQEHYLEDINVSSVARSLYFHRGKVSSLFLKYTGTTLPAYIRETRIDFAKNMLRDGYPVTKAAFSSGFQSIRTFNNSFREIVGVTPSEFLQMDKG